MKVFASMATYQGHRHTVDRAVASIAPQVDQFYLYSNDGFGGLLVRGCTRVRFGADAGDAGKFAFSARHSGEADVWLTCDDDLVYPPDYVAKILVGLERYEHQAAVSFHGARLHDAPKSYRGSREVFSCLKTVHRDQPVHVLGTGTLAFPSRLLRPTLNDFPVKNMADLWFAKLLQAKAIPAVVLAHEEGWLKHLLGPDDPSIWKDGELPETTELVRSIGWKLHMLARPEGAR